MSEQFDAMKAERDALYQATRPVEGSPMEWALELDRRAEQKTRDAEALRLRRAYVLAKYQQPSAGDAASNT
jgi:hypothetical protein